MANTIDFKETKNKDASVKVDFTVGPEEIKTSKQAIVAKMAKNVKIDGFRKGKAPLNVVERRLGDSVWQDTLQHLIDSTLKTVWDDLEYPPMSSPRAELGNFVPDEKFEFTIHYDTEPEIKIGKYKKVKVKMDSVVVNAADIEQELKGIQKQNATYEEVDEPVGPGQKLELKSVTTENGEVKADQGAIKYFTREEGQNEDEGGLRAAIEKNLFGKKKGESTEFDYTYPEDASEEEMRGKTLHFKIDVQKVEKEILPEADDELAKKYEFETLIELKNDIEKKLREQAESKLRDQALQEIIAKIAEGSEFVIPQSLIDREAENKAAGFARQFGLPGGNLETIAQILKTEPDKLRSDFSQSARGSIETFLILREIGEKEEIEVSDQDYSEHLEKQSAQSGEKPEELRQRLEKDGREEEVRAGIKNEKVIDFLIENSAKKGKTLPVREVLDRDKNPEK